MLTIFATVSFAITILVAFCIKERPGANKKDEDEEIELLTDREGGYRDDEL